MQSHIKHLWIVKCDDANESIELYLSGCNYIMLYGRYLFGEGQQRLLENF